MQPPLRCNTLLNSDDLAREFDPAALTELTAFSGFDLPVYLHLRIRDRVFRRGSVFAQARGFQKFIELDKLGPEAKNKIADGAGCSLVVILP